ncbi:MAG: helix-turn-helix domain-containing protein [Fimbriimonadaceae bacterium]|nr:helix-turn-helix domain-containing protein [Fimbriimonadaceae bacterium]
MALVAAVADRPEGAGVRELARQVGLKPPTALNLLRTLVALDYLTFDAARRVYQLGLAPLRLADAVEPVAATKRLAAGCLDAVWAELDETVVLAAWWRGQLVLVDWRTSTRPLLAARPRHLPGQAHGLAAGLVLLAWREPAEQRGYLASLDPPEAAAVAARLPAIRSAGVAWLENHHDNGVGAVAAPVLGPRGQCRYAVGISAPLSRLDAALRARLEQAVRAGADSLRLRLGGEER